MLHVRQILLPTDFSDCAAQALRHAALLADQYQAELHVLHVAEVPGLDLETPYESTYLSDEEIEQKLREATSALPQATEGRLPGGEGPFMHVLRRHAAPGPAILEYAGEHDVDLIVMGTHGRTGLARLLMGSVAEEVVRRATSSVLTVHAEETPVEQAVARLLVPYDFSEHSRYALDYARALAQPYDAALHVLHVVEERSLPSAYGIEPVVVDREEVRVRAREALVRDLQEAGAPEGTVTEVVIGHPVQGILDHVEAQEIGLVVMATHGRTGLQHFFLGSVAEKVVRRAPCPVFTVKSFGKKLLPEASERPAATNVS